MSLPTQIFSLFKLLAYPTVPGTPHGDGIDDAYSSVAPANRTIIDIGLGTCDSLVDEVSKGFVVHGFEPRNESLAHCRKKLDSKSSGLWADVAVAGISQREIAATRRRLRPSTRGGFAFLYNVAVGNVTQTLSFFAMGSSSSISKGAAEHMGPLGHGRERKIDVVRIDEVIDEDIWLLKVDAQGHEVHALSGASGLLASRVVSHIFTEFAPRLLRDNGVPPRALPDLLWSYGFACFDVRNGDGPRYGQKLGRGSVKEGSYAAPWALGKDHPTDLDEYIRAMDRNAEDGMKRNERGEKKPALWAQRYGSSDDLACVNLRRATK